MSIARDSVAVISQISQYIGFFYAKISPYDEILASFESAWSTPIDGMIEQVLNGTLKVYSELDARFQYGSTLDREAIELCCNKIEAKKNKNIKISEHENLFLAIFYFHHNQSQEAWSHLRLIADNPVALLYAGYMLYVPCSIENHINKARDCLKRAAKAGIPDAFRCLGILSQEIDNDLTKAIKYYERAVAMGDTEAQLALGEIYFNDNNNPQVETDEKTAIEYYRTAVMKGNVKAINSYGYFLQYGKGVPKDEKQAVNFYKIAADKNFSEALDNLGYCYLTGSGVKKNKELAFKILNEALAKQGFRAFYSLGVCYEEENNLAMAAQFYCHAIEKGESRGIRAIVNLFYKNKDLPSIIYYAGKAHLLIHSSKDMQKLFEKLPSIGCRSQYHVFLTVRSVFNKLAKEKPEEFNALLREDDMSLSTLNSILPVEMTKEICKSNLTYFKKQTAKITEVGFFPNVITAMISSYTGADRFEEEKNWKKAINFRS